MKVAVVLIHNRDTKRLQKARNSVGALCDTLREAGAHVTDFEVYDQAWIGDLRLTFGDIIQRQVRIGLSSARLLRRVSRLWGAYGVCRMLFDLASICLSRRARLETFRRAPIEMALSSKHVSAWGIAKSEQASHLIVLEDDAIWNADTHGVRKIFEGLLIDKDLCGACLCGSLDWSLIPTTEKRVEGPVGFIVSRPMTNGTVAYLMSRDLYEFCYESIIASGNADISEFPADWMLNELYGRYPDAGGERRSLYVCLDPPLFIHGSGEAGVYSTSIQTEDAFRD